MSKHTIFIIPVILSVLVTCMFLLLTVGNNAFAWHGQLGISGERAAEKV
jgi:hypothetical protein